MKISVTKRLIGKTYSLLLILVILNPHFALAMQDANKSAKNLWSVTSVGGDNGFGTIFRFQPANGTFTKVHDFDGSNGYPFASLTFCHDRLWGMTMGRTGTPGNREQAGHGAIFNLKADGTGFRNVHSFNGLNGSRPLGELIVHGEKIWGMTEFGGKHNLGVIFTVQPDGSGYKKVHDFDGALGARPRNSLLLHEGKFWGVTSSGGANDLGVIFQLNVDGDGFSTVYDFENTNGGHPESGLTLFQNKFWGMTTQGGKNGQGSVFSVDTSGTKFKKVHDLEYPALGDLIVSNSKLWGMMALQGKHNAGSIFTVDKNGYEDVHHFDKANGRFPEGNLFESNGELWGMTRFGGNSNVGVIFKVSLNDRTFTKVFDFDSKTGGIPYGTFVEAPF